MLMPRTRAGYPLTVVLASAGLALGVGLVAGGVLISDDAPRVATAVSTPCPNTEHSGTAACLLNTYLGLVDESASTRNAGLTRIVLPSQLVSLRTSLPRSAPVNGPGQPARYAKVADEYSTVVAVRPGAAPDTYRAPDVGWMAWVCVVDAYAAGSPPLANWYLGHFAVRWQGGRWWLSDGFHADELATPMTYTEGPEARPFGPEWTSVS